MDSPPNSLALGFYTVPEAARLIDGGSARRLRGWLRGYPPRSVGPLVARQFEGEGERQEIGFLDLMELRLVEALRSNGVKVGTIRRAIEEARRLFGSEKPFATDRITLRTDGRSVFVEEVLKKVAQETDDRRLWNLVTRQYAAYDLIERSLSDGVQFDPETHLARRWHPRPRAFPGISIDPAVASGKPVTLRNVPTQAVHELWLAEDKDIDAAAGWFGLDRRAAEEAVRFEEALANTPERRAA